MAQREIKITKIFLILFIILFGIVVIQNVYAKNKCANLKVNFNNQFVTIFKNINIQPSLKDIFYGNLIFDSVKIESLYLNNISNITFNDEFTSNNNFLIPKIIIKEILVESGSVKYNELNI